jgi:hypothetical protein
MATLSGVAPMAVSAAGGILTPDIIRRAVKPRAVNRSEIGLVVLENTHNLAGGVVSSVEQAQAAIAACRAAGLRVHVDGARLWNAAVAQGVEPSALVAGADSAMVTLSKGLCCPVGSVLLCSATLIGRARRIRQQLGGGMRQAGILAAAGLVALETMIPRLAEDHRNAAVLADALTGRAGIAVTPVQTNIVVASLDDRSAPAFSEALKQRGVWPRPWMRPRCASSRTTTSRERTARRRRGRSRRCSIGEMGSVSLMRRARRGLGLAAAFLAPCALAAKPFVETASRRECATASSLRADVVRPAREGRFPVLVYRTPYGKGAAFKDYSTFERAVARGYAVVIQDVRGRYASDGDFEPYRNEGRDGYDTIEWAAAQPWSNGSVGTFGLSYPGAVQWLAAVESPPHLKAMAPAMTFSTPRNFFHSGGVFDLSWLDWIWNDIAADARVRKGLPGARTDEESAAEWPRVRDDLNSRLPLTNLPELKEIAPYYFAWLSHPPGDPWWDWCELRNKYGACRRRC